MLVTMEKGQHIMQRLTKVGKKILIEKWFLNLWLKVVEKVENVQQSRILDHMKRIAWGKN